MKHFTLTAEHVKLLRAMNVGWDDCEFGAPCIDPKRPYGNSDPLPDMAQLLGEPSLVCPDCGCRISSGNQEERLSRLHKETEVALQVVLATGSFKPGSYVASECDSDWKREEAKP